MFMPTNAPGSFAIVKGKGFHITFENGCTASVQFGESNYCDNNRYEKLNRHIGVSSNNAEIAAWNADGDWITPEGFDFNGDSVIGYAKPAEVLRFINAIAAL